MDTLDLSLKILMQRRRAGLTQEDVAKALSLRRITVNRAERNPEMVKPETISKILTFVSEQAEKNLPAMLHSS
jgi:DNA-binding XRE family transcriptional regulator